MMGYNSNYEDVKLDEFIENDSHETQQADQQCVIKNERFHTLFEDRVDDLYNNLMTPDEQVQLFDHEDTSNQQNSEEETELFKLTEKEKTSDKKVNKTSNLQRRERPVK